MYLKENRLKPDYRKLVSTETKKQSFNDPAFSLLKSKSLN